MIGITKPKNDYLFALSTPHGIMQHTMFNLPDPEHGYSTDDNARALIVANLWKNTDIKKKKLLRNLETGYLRFLKFARDESSSQFYCYISFDLHKKDLGLGDWYGRSAFALAYLAYYSKLFEKAAWEMTQKTLPLIFNKEFSIRTKAFLIFAMYYILKKNETKRVLRNGELDRYKKVLKMWRTDLKEMATRHFSDKWIWPERTITYDNGKVIQAYLLLGEILKDKELTEMGRRMLEFYLHATLKKDHFQFPGNKHFWTRGEKMPVFDEQAVEAYSMTASLISAYLIFKDRNYLRLARLCYRWFWGRNRLHKTLVDRASGAVYDGLMKKQINDNQGAESYLALNLAYFALTKKIHL